MRARLRTLGRLIDALTDDRRLIIVVGPNDAPVPGGRVIHTPFVGPDVRTEDSETGAIP